MAEFPDDLFTGRDVENREGVEYDAEKTKVFFAEDHNKAVAEIEAIEAFIGTKGRWLFSSRDELSALADDDKIGIQDESATKELKYSLWSTIKSTLKTYFDTLYTKCTGAEIITGTNDVKFATPKAISDAGILPTTLRSFFIPASAFKVIEGSPTEADLAGNIGFYWTMPDAADSGLGTSIVIPEDYASGYIYAYIYYSQTGTASGDVRFAIRRSYFYDEDGAILTADSAGGITDTIIATAGDLNITTGFNLAGSPAAGKAMILAVRRNPNDAADTLGADIVFLGLKITYTGK